jgi:hypothetical protein
LNHAQNLTQAQISESIGNDSTILPAHLKTPELWQKTSDVPPTPSPRTDLGDFGWHDQISLDISQTAVIRKPAWLTGALLCGAIVVVAGIIWHSGTSLDRPGFGENKLLSGAPTTIESEVGSEGQPGSTPNPPPTEGSQAAPINTVEPDRVTRPHETKAGGEQQVLGDGKLSAEAFMSREQAHSALENDTAPASVATPLVTPSPHGTRVDPAHVSTDPQAVPPQTDYRLV